MDESKPQAESWEDAVSEASQHVEDRTAKADAVADGQKPKPDGPKVVAALIVLTVVLAWNIRVATQPIEPPPISSETTHLTWFVVDAVEAIEDFRADEGRLPTAQEAAELLEDDVTYQVRGDGYVITVDDEVRSLEYDGSIPLAEWQEIYTDSGEGGGG